jgi:hypothetical protein
MVPKIGQKNGKVLGSAGEAQAVFAHVIDGDARPALHDDELAAGVGAVGQFHQALEIVGTPHAGPGNIVIWRGLSRLADIKLGTIVST